MLLVVIIGISWAGWCMSGHGILSISCYQDPCTSHTCSEQGQGRWSDLPSCPVAMPDGFNFVAPDDLFLPGQQCGVTEHLATLQQEPLQRVCKVQKALVCHCR